MSRVLALSLLWLAFTASAPSSSASGGQDKLEALAAMGKIQENAPVKAASEITIKAPKEKIWQILTSIDDWPSWQSTTSAAHLNGQLAPGSTFTWKSGGAEINSRIALVRKDEEIGWTGTAYKARAVHIWSLQSMPDGSTLVKTRESMDGFLLTVFYSSKDLAKSHEIWLQALKRRAEQ